MSGEQISLDDLPEGIAGVRPSAAAVQFAGPRPTLREFREIMERQFIEETLDENGWNISRSALVLGIERTNLHKKLKVLGLSRRGAD